MNTDGTRHSAGCDVGALVVPILSRDRLSFALVVFPDEDPMWTLHGVRIQSLAVVAPHALGHHDLRTAYRSPFARLLAELTGVAL